MPFKNEHINIQASLPNLYNWLSQEIKDFEILCVDDHSEDESKDIIAGLNFQRVRIINNRFDRGKGSALKTAVIFSGVMYALKDDDLVLFIDGAGQFDNSDIKMFLNLIHIYNSDVVIGNKRHASSCVSYGTKRRIVSFIYNLMTRILFGITFRDTQSGMKLFRYGILDGLIHKVNSKRYAFDLELIVAIKEMGYRIVDAPVKVRKSLNKGSVRFSTILLTLFDTLVIFINKSRGKYAQSDVRSTADILK